MILRVVASNSRQPGAVSSNHPLLYPRTSKSTAFGRKNCDSLCSARILPFSRGWLTGAVKKPSTNPKQKLLRQPADVDPPLHRNWLPSPRRSLSADRVRSSRRASETAIRTRCASSSRRRRGDWRQRLVQRRAAQDHQCDGSLGAQPRAAREAGAEEGDSEQTHTCDGCFRPASEKPLPSPWQRGEPHFDPLRCDAR